MVIFSGIQPTGRKHLGNYIGAILQYVEGQDRAIRRSTASSTCTGRPSPTSPPSCAERSRDTAALLVAAGLDPERCVLFRQGDVPQHTELTWLLASVTSVGQLNRMHQFRDKSGAARERASAGLLFYPVLMAADVLAYRAHEVPVGEDQREHIELMRDVAENFNRALRRDADRPGGQHPDGRRPRAGPAGAGQEDVDHRRHARRARSTSTRRRRASSRSSAARRPTRGARSCAPRTSPGSRT